MIASTKKSTIETEAAHRVAVDERAAQIHAEKNWLMDGVKRASDAVRAALTGTAAAEAAQHYDLVPADLLAGDPRAFAELDRLFDADGGWHANNCAPLEVFAVDTFVDAFGSADRNPAMNSRGAPCSESVRWATESAFLEWLKRRYSLEQSYSLRNAAARVIVRTGAGKRDHTIYVRTGGEWNAWTPDVTDGELLARRLRADADANAKAAQARVTANFNDAMKQDPGLLLRLAQRAGLVDEHGHAVKETTDK